MIFETEVRRVSEIEIRVEAANAEEAHAKALEIAENLDEEYWSEHQISVVQAGRAYDHHEHKIKYDGEFLVCECGNTPDSDGFTTTTTDGIEVEPEPQKWDGKTYRCDRCGSVKSVEKASA
jgi:hypothetical protein